MTIRSAGFGPADEFGQTTVAIVLQQFGRSLRGFGTSLLHSTDEQCTSPFTGLRKVQVTLR
jgi:hypothetical protein